LAASKIINAARSPMAAILLNFKFPINVQSYRIEVFKAAVEKYVKDRPRQVCIWQ
jgi:hypothetical protein